MSETANDGGSRGDRPFVFTNLKDGTNIADVRAFVERAGRLA